MAKLRGIKAEKRTNANAWVVQKPRDMLALLGLENPELRDACSLKQGQFRQYFYQARDFI